MEDELANDSGLPTTPEEELLRLEEESIAKSYGFSFSACDSVTQAQIIIAAKKSLGYII